MPVKGHEGREKGILMIPADSVTDMVVHFDSMGLVVKFHAAGDQAVRTALDAIAAAREVNGFNGLRHVVNIAKAIGDERMKRMYAFKDSLDASVHTVVGSDWPVVPFVNPWIAIETMVTRQAPSGSEEAVAPDEAITLEQAVDMFTIEAARQLNTASYTGSIEVGKLADLVVIDRNVFEIPITEVHQTRTLRTFINGEEVYTAE